MTRTLARNYIAGHQFWHVQCTPAVQCDVQYENGLFLNKYMLLYEELSYVMNSGDIGWVETCLVTWIPMFKATGKHKYANAMTDFLCKVHLQMKKHSPNEIVKGCGSYYSIPDILAKGQELMEKSSIDNEDGGKEAAIMEGKDECPSVDDFAVELVW
ncbi:hypothetical protein BD769DRAFT_1351738 [Suillus cothurnatus]|nr:hypothetical protein BD769DRAFT_1351738 [Suillus cothurnatus]